jgi:hypothetical protein
LDSPKRRKVVEGEEEEVEEEPINRQKNESKEADEVPEEVNSK